MRSLLIIAFFFSFNAPLSLYTTVTCYVHMVYWISPITFCNPVWFFTQDTSIHTNFNKKYIQTSTNTDKTCLHTNISTWNRHQTYIHIHKTTYPHIYPHPKHTHPHTSRITFTLKNKAYIHISTSTHTCMQIFTHTPTHPHPNSNQSTQKKKPGHLHPPSCRHHLQSAEKHVRHNV